MCTVSAAAAAVFVCVRAEYGCAFYWHYCLLLHFLSFTMIAVWSSRLWPFSWFVAHLKWFRHKHKHNVPCALGKLSLVVCACVRVHLMVCVCVSSIEEQYEIFASSTTPIGQAKYENENASYRVETHWSHRCGRDMKSRELNHPIHIQCGNFYLCACECVCVCLCVDIVSISEDV